MTLFTPNLPQDLGLLNVNGFSARQILFSTLVLALFLWFIKPVFNSGLQAIPGPFLAKFSNLWRLIDTWKGSHHVTLMNLHRRHGNLVRVGPNTVSISNVDAIEGIFGVKTDFVKVRSTPEKSLLPLSPVFESPRKFLVQRRHNGKTVPTIVTIKDRKAHAAFKRPIAPAFAMTNLTKYGPLVDNIIRQLILRLDQQFASTGESCPIDDWLQYFSLDVIGSMTYSRSFSLLADGRDTHNLLATLYDEFFYITLVAQMPWLDKVFRKNRLIDLLRKDPSNALAVHAFKLLQSRLAASKTEQEQDFVSYLLDYQQAHPDQLTPERVFSHTIVNAVVGADSTSVALRACIYFLCRHPHTLATLRNELDANNHINLPLTPESFPVITWSMAQNLPYLDAVIKESLRLHPPGAIQSERIVPTEGLRVGDVDIPPGTIVGMSGWLTQRHESIFGSDSNAFRPERWLPGKGETDSDWQTRTKAMNRAMIVFGHGPSACLGAGLARFEIYKCVPALVQAFDMELAKPHEEWKVENIFFARQTNMDVKLKRRRPGAEISQ
ncbi:MAG: hypothetical protein Q9191_005133 [Dirinaria sp. TL-2023a]